MGRGEKIVDFVVCQDLAVETDFNTKIQQCVHAENGGRRRTNGRLDRWAARPVHAPIGRHADNKACPLHRLHIVEEAHGVLRRPAQGMKNFARIDDCLQPRALLARQLHGGEKLQELGLVPGASVFPQGLAERLVA